MRLTVAVPAAHMADANDLAMVLAHGPADGQTYRNAIWQDAQGNIYAAASFEAPPEWVAAAQSPLYRPEWDVQPYQISMAAADRAQALIVLGEDVTAAPDRIAVRPGDNGPAALAAMGLTPVLEGI